MKTKKALGIIAMMFIIAISSLFADTIIDSVYSTPELDGDIKFSQNNQSYIVDNWMYDMVAGDIGISMIWPDPNSILRAYVSFELP